MQTHRGETQTPTAPEGRRPRSRGPTPTAARRTPRCPRPATRRPTRSSPPPRRPRRTRSRAGTSSAVPAGRVRCSPPHRRGSPPRHAPRTPGTAPPPRRTPPPPRGHPRGRDHAGPHHDPTPTPNRGIRRRDSTTARHSPHHRNDPHQAHHPDSSADTSAGRAASRSRPNRNRPPMVRRDRRVVDDTRARSPPPPLPRRTRRWGAPTVGTALVPRPPNRGAGHGHGVVPRAPHGPDAPRPPDSIAPRGAAVLSGGFPVLDTDRVRGDSFWGTRSASHDRGSAGALVRMIRPDSRAPAHPCRPRDASMSTAHRTATSSWRSLLRGSLVHRA